MFVRKWVRQILGSEQESQRSGVTFIYYPPFENEDADFSDHYYRAVWYLHPIKDHLREIVIPYKGQTPTLGEVPAYLDSTIKAMEPAMRPLFRYVDMDTIDAEALISSADRMMVWRTVDPSEGRIPPGPARHIVKQKPIWRVDHQRERYAGSFYLKASHELYPDDADIAESREKFHSIPESVFSDIGYIFGTGPNLQQAMDHDFSDGVSIACNSMLRNRELMEKLNPPLITVADPIFHAGASSYAGDFRRYLVDALDHFESYLIVPMRDYRIYTANLDKRFHNRIIGVPFVTGDDPNLNLHDEFHVTTTANIMTLFLIPLATTFFKTIYTAGFDGRPLEENNYFWKHDPKVQIVERMDDIKLAHPAFFAIDYDEYYLTHIDIVERWLTAAEAKGFMFRNFTQSYVPALKSRTV